MPNYRNSKIYKLTSNQTNKIYIGSTTKELSRRMTCHKWDYKKWCDNKQDYITSFELLKYNDCKIILIVNYPCNNISELRIKEQDYIDLYKEICVNKYNAKGRDIKKTKKLKNRHYIKNKEKYLIDAKKYANDNKEKVKKYKQEWNFKNKQKLCNKKSQKILCECGIIHTFGNKARHFRSERHINYKKIQDQIEQTNNNYNLLKKYII